MSDYSSVLTYTINRGVAVGAGSIILSQSGVVEVCLLATPIQACSPKNPKCEGKTETFYSVLDNSLKPMFVTDERGWAYIRGENHLDVQTYGINRGVSVLKDILSLCPINFNIKSPIAKQVLACPKDDPKCKKQSAYYQFFNSLNKLLFITDQEGYELINPSKDVGDIVKQL